MPRPKPLPPPREPTANDLTNIEASLAQRSGLSPGEPFLPFYARLEVMNTRLPVIATVVALLSTSTAFASSSHLSAYVPLNVPPAISLHAGEHRTFSAVTAPTGTVVACRNRGIRAELKVPPVTAHALKSFSAIAFKNGGGSAQIHITRRSLNRIVVTCNP
jgi:hypothetical protein